jgi:hypothetical protein
VATPFLAVIDARTRAGRIIKPVDLYKSHVTSPVQACGHGPCTTCGMAVSASGNRLPGCRTPRGSGREVAGRQVAGCREGRASVSDETRSHPHRRPPVRPHHLQQGHRLGAGANLLGVRHRTPARPQVVRACMDTLLERCSTPNSVPPNPPSP